MITKTIPVASPAERAAIADAADKLRGWPVRGVHGGSGFHVPIPDTFSPNAPGWTSHHSGAPDEIALDTGAIEALLDSPHNLKPTPTAVLRAALGKARAPVPAVGDE